jgi:transposase
MDVLAGDFDGFISHLFEKSNNLLSRDLTVCYYDCTNFYFEIEKEDQEYIDGVTGEVVHPLREYGFSKEHRPNPIIQMGLFMDSDGIPLSMCLHSGSTNEQLTAIPAEKKIVEMFKGKEFIYCADAGLGSYNIRRYNSFSKRAFIITQSIKKLSADMQEAVFDNTDYKLLSSDKSVTIEYMKEFDRNVEENRILYNDKAYKVIAADHSIELNGFYDEKHYLNGNTRQVKSKVTIPQSLIITFSRKQFEYQRAVRNRQIERAKKLLADAKNPEEIKKGPNDIRRFIRRKKTKAEENSAIQDLYEINNDRILEEEKYDGFYAIATNLDILDAKLHVNKHKVLHVLSIMANRNKIEDDFRIMKTNFDARPVYHHLPDRIKAHFMICYAALLVHRLLEKLIDDAGPDHFTINDLIETIRNINIAPTDPKFCTALYTGSKILSTLQSITGIHLDMKHYRTKDLDMIIRKLVKK